MNNEAEVWKDIEGYEGIYQVSNLGRVKVLPRYFNSRGYNELRKERILTQGKVGKYRNYHSVTLTLNGVRKHCKVHRLVAEAFIPNPNNYPMINHKDENPSNNHVDNLEWCTNQYNVCYGTSVERARAKLKGKSRTELQRQHIKDAQIKRRNRERIERSLLNE